LPTIDRWGVLSWKAPCGFLILIARAAWSYGAERKDWTKVSAAYPPSFYMHLDDPTSHMEMIEGLESRYKLEDCVFRTIYGNLQGYRIFASHKVTEKIEKQTRYEAKLYNVDVRQDQRYVAEHDIFP
jgi:hypothetical protein